MVARGNSVYRKKQCGLFYYRAFRCGTISSVTLNGQSLYIVLSKGFTG
jgi:hypothetical protein